MEMPKASNSNDMLDNSKRSSVLVGRDMYSIVVAIDKACAFVDRTTICADWRDRIVPLSAKWHA